MHESGTMAAGANGTARTGAAGIAECFVSPAGGARPGSGAAFPGPA